MASRTGGRTDGRMQVLDMISGCGGRRGGTRTDGHMEWVNERKGGLWLLIWLGTTTIVFDIADQIPFPRHGGDLFWIVSLDSLGQKLNSRPFYPTTIVRHFGVHVVHTHTAHVCDAHERV